MTEDQVRELLRERIGDKRGAQAAFARQAGVTRAYISIVLAGGAVGPSIIAALGLEKAPCVYREIDA